MLGGRHMIKSYVGVTDFDWFQLLREEDGIEEINFWQPGGKRQFKTLAAGDLFLFKLKSPRNFIVGGGALELRGRRGAPFAVGDGVEGKGGLRISRHPRLA